MATVTYKLHIIPSPSNFVETVSVHASLNAGPPLVLASGLPSNTISINYDFPVDAAVEWWVEVIGDNGSTAISNHRMFAAANLEQVLPATADAETFVKYNT